jgi:ABC-type transporter Mla subunit MlaD
MPVQDLTPQLRTRLNRLEKLVGVFVTVATLLLLTGLAYYVYHTAQRKGWFLTKAPYFVYLNNGAGFKVGDSVKLMGFDVGQITEITAAEPYKYDDNGNMVNVYVQFVVRYPFFDYVWDDSAVKVKSAGLLGDRYLEVTKGGTSGTTNKLYASYKTGGAHELRQMLIRPTKQNAGAPGVYTNYTAGMVYWLDADEPPELSSQMDAMLRTAKESLPAFLDLTNQLTRILNNANTAVSHLDGLLVGAQPVVSNMNAAVTNLTAIAAYLRETEGGLGEMLLPTNIQKELVLLLPNLNGTVTNLNTNLVSVVANLNAGLENLAGITSNLHAQVQANTNILSNISTTIIHTDDLIQGLKRHWLLRSAFKTKPAESKTNAPPPLQPAQSPKGASGF